MVLKFCCLSICICELEYHDKKLLGLSVQDASWQQAMIFKNERETFVKKVIRQIFQNTIRVFKQIFLEDLLTLSKILLSSKSFL